MRACTCLSYTDASGRRHQREPDETSNTFKEIHTFSGIAVIRPISRTRQPTCGGLFCARRSHRPNADQRLSCTKSICPTQPRTSHVSNSSCVQFVANSPHKRQRTSPVIQPKRPPRRSHCSSRRLDAHAGAAGDAKATASSPTNLCQLSQSCRRNWLTRALEM